MTESKLKQIINHLWEYREYLYPHGFDCPFYGGLKGKMGRESPESVDAMQNIWDRFVNMDSFGRSFRTKRQFENAYRAELSRLGKYITRR